MTIKLLAVGKTDDGCLQELVDVYTKRLCFYNKFDIEIILDLKKAKNLDKEQQKQKEGKLILEKINNSDHVILLDEKGKEYTSEGFSEYIQKKLNSGRKQLIF